MAKSVSSGNKSKKSSSSKQGKQPSASDKLFVPLSCFQDKREQSTLPIFVVSVDDYSTWINSAPEEIQAWLGGNRFKAKPGACALLPQTGGCAGALITVRDPHNPWEFAGLTKILPEGSFEAEPELDAEVAHALCLGWLLSSYQFTKYKSSNSRPKRKLVWPEEAPRSEVLALGEGICLARDLINTPASDMGPEEMARVAEHLCKEHKAKLKVTVGDQLLTENYPMIHAVGRASSRTPRLIDLRWGKKSHPKLTLVGKGVCFDTGGLDIKPAQYMKLMKKDMGGAGFILGLAHTIMSHDLPVQLRVLVPAVENSVSGNAMRPLDVLSTRKGVTVEVGDTDAEGRLVLGDALFEAQGEKPDLIVDAATLTGAARVALGTEIPVVFSNRDTTYSDLLRASESTHDPLWRLPLFDGYRRKLESKVADLSNISTDSFGGAITAALFLREFASRDQDWLHIDTMGFNLEARPGRPYGGEALGLLAVFRMLRERYALTTTEQAATKADAGTFAKSPKNPKAGKASRPKRRSP